MILCHCAVVSEKTVEQLIDEGAHSVAEIVRRCGAGRRCAPCRAEISAMLYAAATLPHTAAEAACESDRPTV